MPIVRIVAILSGEVLARSRRTCSENRRCLDRRGLSRNRVGRASRVTVIRDRLPRTTRGDRRVSTTIYPETIRSFSSSLFSPVACDRSLARFRSLSVLLSFCGLFSFSAKPSVFHSRLDRRARFLDEAARVRPGRPARRPLPVVDVVVIGDGSEPSTIDSSRAIAGRSFDAAMTRDRNLARSHDPENVIPHSLFPATGELSFCPVRL